MQNIQVGGRLPQKLLSRHRHTDTVYIDTDTGPTGPLKC